MYMRVYAGTCMCVYDVCMCMMYVCMCACLSMYVCSLSFSPYTLTLSTNFAYIHETDSHNTMSTHVPVPKNMTFYPMQGTTWFNLNIFFKVP